MYLGYRIPPPSEELNGSTRLECQQYYYLPLSAQTHKSLHTVRHSIRNFYLAHFCANKFAQLKSKDLILKIYHKLFSRNYIILIIGCSVRHVNFLWTIPGLCFVISTKFSLLKWRDQGWLCQNLIGMHYSTFLLTHYVTIKAQNNFTLKFE